MKLAATLLAALLATGGRHRARPDAELDVWRARSSSSAPSISYAVQTGVCPAPSFVCNAGNNLLAHPEDLSNAAWTTFGAGVAAPTVSAAYTRVIDGQTVTCNRVQFAAVASSGQESSIFQRIDDGARTNACKQIDCTYSSYIRPYPGGAGPSSGTLPQGTAALGGDGQGQNPCTFTSEFTRCVKTMASPISASFSYIWLGPVFGQSGASPALDLEICGPKVEYGVGGATAYQCPSPLQDQSAVAHTGYRQSLVTADWGILPRDGAGLVRLPNGKHLLCGGWRATPEATWSEDGGANNTTNQCYLSADDGASWSLVLAHKDDPPQSGAGQRPRRTHSQCFLLDNAGNYVWQLGSDFFDDRYSSGDGTGGPARRDVWRSAVASEGATWEARTLAAEWGQTTLAADGGYNSRVLHYCWFDGSDNLYVGGGQSGLVSSSALSTFYRSTAASSGAAFTLQSGSAPARGTFANGLPYFGGKNWMAFGEVYDADPGQRLYFNDALSFTPAAGWVTENPNTGIAPRGYHNLIAWNGRLWALKGYDGSNRNDLVSSADGVCWRKERASPGPVEHAASVAVSADGGALIITGASTSAAVWKVNAIDGGVP